MNSQLLSELTAQWEAKHGPIKTLDLVVRGPEVVEKKEEVPLSSARIKARTFLQDSRNTGLTTKEIASAISVSPTVIREEAKNLDYKLKRPQTSRRSPKREEVILNLGEPSDEVIAREVGVTEEYVRRIRKELEK